MPNETRKADPVPSSSVRQTDELLTNNQTQTNSFAEGTGDAHDASKSSDLLSNPASPHRGSPLISATKTCEAGSLSRGIVSEYWHRPHSPIVKSRTYDRSHKCTQPNCEASFGTKNDLDRHHKSCHSILHPRDRVWICTVPACLQSEKVWPRRDNFKQHITRMHPECHDDIDMMETCYDPALHRQPERSKRSVQSRSSRPTSIAPSSQALLYDPKEDLVASGMFHKDHMDWPSTASTNGQRSLRSTEQGHAYPSTIALEPQNYDKMWFACPYYKYSPLDHVSRSPGTDTVESQSCGSISLHSISEVKQHLRRRHVKPDAYCPICFAVFARRDLLNSHLLNSHIRERRCALDVKDPFGACTTEEKLKEIDRIYSRSYREEGPWFSIFKLLFPGAIVPESPYLDNELEAWHRIMLRIFQELGERADDFYRDLETDKVLSIPPLNKAVIEQAHQTFQQRCQEQNRASVTYVSGHTELPLQGTSKSPGPVQPTSDAQRTTDRNSRPHHSHNGQDESLRARREVPRKLQRQYDTLPPTLTPKTKVVTSRASSNGASVAAVEKGTQEDVRDGFVVGSEKHSAKVNVLEPTRARRSHPDEAWEDLRGFIKHAYIVENRTLVEVMQLLEDEHDFVVTEKMFKTRLKKWAMSKYVKDPRNASTAAEKHTHRSRVQQDLGQDLDSEMTGVT